jgi:hypothetical protein
VIVRETELSENAQLDCDGTMQSHAVCTEPYQITGCPPSPNPLTSEKHQTHPTVFDPPSIVTYMSLKQKKKSRDKSPGREAVGIIEKLKGKK